VQSVLRFELTFEVQHDHCNVVDHLTLVWAWWLSLQEVARDACSSGGVFEGLAHELPHDVRGFVCFLGRVLYRLLNNLRDLCGGEVVPESVTCEHEIPVFLFELEHLNFGLMTDVWSIKVREGLAILLLS
jgi:hypothetical protein